MRAISVVLFSSLVLLANCGTSDVPPSPEVFPVTAGPSNVDVRVRDADGPVVNATVTVEGVSVKSDGAGLASLATIDGPHQMRIDSAGYLPWRGRLEHVGSESVAVLLRKAEPAVTVGPAPSSLQRGAATLEIPAGAFAAATTLTATWLAAGEVLSVTSETFVADGSKSQRIFGKLVADASAQPSVPVQITVSIPDRIDIAKVALCDRQADGACKTLLAPSSVMGNVATFAVPHFSEWDAVETLEVDSEHLWPYSVVAIGCSKESGCGESTVTHATNQQIPAEPLKLGLQLANGDTFDVPDGAEVALQHYLGTTVTWRQCDGCGSATVRLRSTARFFFTAGVDYVGTATAVGRNIKAYVSSQWDDLRRRLNVAVKLFEIPNLVDLWDKGTLFSVRETFCASDPNAQFVQVRVASGSVHATTPGTAFDVGGGEEAYTCVGCKKNKRPFCACDPVACEKAGGACLTCKDLPEGQVTARIGNIDGCAPRGAICCGAPTGAYCGTGESCVGGRCVAYGGGGAAPSAQTIAACYTACGGGNPSCDATANPPLCKTSPLRFWCDGDCYPTTQGTMLKGPRYCASPYRCSAGAIAVCCDGGSTFDWYGGDPTGCSVSATCLARCNGLAVCGGGRVSTRPVPPVAATQPL